MNAPVVMHDTVRHRGRVLRARILCDVWMYTDSQVRISRGDLVARDRGRATPDQWYEVTALIATNGVYQKFRVAKA